MDFIKATALITPYNEQGIDYGVLAQLIERQQQADYTHILINGTTGEPMLLDKEEKRTQLRFAAQHKGKMQLMAGCGATNTNEAVENCLSAQHCGADCLLLVTPFYNKTSQQGAVEHYLTIADKVDIPLYLYNVPSRTGFDLSVESIIELAKHRRIAGVKQANGKLNDAAKLIPYLDDFRLLCGDDGLILPFAAVGASGYVSVASNIYPRLVADAVTEKLPYYLLTKLSELLFAEVNPMPVKYLMYSLGLLPCYTLRKPLAPIKCQLAEALNSVAAELEQYL